MCISFHPEHPAIIAGGTFNGNVFTQLDRIDMATRSKFHMEWSLFLSFIYIPTNASQSCFKKIVIMSMSVELKSNSCTTGEIYLWNIGNVTDPLLASSPLSETSHKEPISKVINNRSDCTSQSGILAHVLNHNQTDD